MVDGIYKEYKGDVAIIIVYVREAHAGQRMFRNVRQPDTQEQRVALAKKMRVEHDIETPIVVTSMANTVQRGYGGLPNMAFLIGKDRKVLYKEPWANPAAWPPMLDKVLEHRDKNTDAADLVIGVGANTGPRVPRTAVPKRAYHPSATEGEGEQSTPDPGDAGDEGKPDDEEEEDF